jgi:hypothetical protein
LSWMEKFEFVGEMEGVRVTDREVEEQREPEGEPEGELVREDVRQVDTVEDTHLLTVWLSEREDEKVREPVPETVLDGLVVPHAVLEADLQPEMDWDRVTVGEIEVERHRVGVIERLSVPDWE